MSWTRRGYAWARTDHWSHAGELHRDHARFVWAKSVWVVSLLTGVQPHVIVNGGREQDVAWARMVALKLTRRYSSVGLPAIADVANVDRTSVRNAEVRIDQLAEENVAVADVWRDARRLMDLEVRHAENVGVLLFDRTRYQECQDRVLSGAEDFHQRVRRGRHVPNAKLKKESEPDGSEAEAT